MLIILEGPDCAGKTTLAMRLETAIRRRYPASDEILHLTSGPPERHPLDEYVVPLLGYRPMSGTHVICDRLHLGERVYPQVFGRSSEMNHAVFMHTESFLQSRGALVIYVMPPVATLVHRMQLRGDDLVRPEQLAAIRAGFVKTTRETVLPHLITDDGEVIDATLERARLIEVGAAPLNPFVTYTGPPHPFRLLLGDVRGPAFRTDDPIDKIRPAFMPYRSMSGAYLWKTLGRSENTGLRAGNIGVANACDVDDPRELWHVLGRPQVVTLGRNAARAFSGAHEAPHPQWVRRFHHNRVDDYNIVLTSREPVSWN